jgi:pyrimidine operon attenuation protein / uracil phosphoribosyltransferase
MSHSAVTPAPRVLLDEESIRRTLSRVAHEIIERNEDLDTVALVGIHTRGVPIAHRLRHLIEERTGEELALGQLDITFHRDDVHVRAGQPPRRPQPLARETKLDFELEGRTVILVDDVLYTGRTVRAALDAVTDLGRPRAIRLAVLIDRGLRELPIQADYIGKVIPTSRREHIDVALGAQRADADAVTVFDEDRAAP